MTAKQHRDAIQALGMSQARASDLAALALGQSEIPEAVAMLLRLMIRLRLKPEQTVRQDHKAMSLGCARERLGG
jgi:predicted XRE-type DNA-binding protein